MSENIFIPQKNQSLLNKFPSGKSPKEQKQTRIVLGMIFGFTVFSVLLAIGYREIPKWLKKLNEPRIAVSEKLTPIIPTATPTPKFENERKSVEEMISPLRGEYGVYFEEIETKENFGINSTHQFIAASLIKMPVLITLYREAEAGRINLDQVYKLQVADKRGGAGALQYKEVGYEISFRDMAKLMGQQSDNTAFNVVSKALGDEKIQATIDALGMKNTSYSENLTTPLDMGTLFRKLYLEKVVSDKDRDEILSFITDTIWEDRIPAGLPKGIKSAHKIGTEVGVISDAGIVFSPKPFILVIISQEANEIEAKKALPEITKKIYELTQEKVN